MEGWLYLIGSNRLGLRYSRKRYFVLEDNTLNWYMTEPASKREDPMRSAVIDSCIHVTDNGKESIHRNVLYIFTLYNASNGNNQLKLGARSSEEAVRWIRRLMRVVIKECPNQEENLVACTHKRWHSFRPSHGRTSPMLPMDWTVLSFMHADPMSSDVIAPSLWAIFGCRNGLRLFKEAKDGDFPGKYWDDHPAIMAVGVVDATSEAVFQTLISLGPSRSEWDFCLLEGRVVEHLDNHTDIIHKKLRSDWLPWGMRRRDLLLRRYWRKEDDGTYVILYRSVFHPKCQPERGYIRACLKSGGYVISPVNQGKQSVVKHMLAIDWKFWKSYLLASSAKYITIQMLGKVAALREFFQATLGNYPFSDLSSVEMTGNLGFPQTEKEHIKEEVLSASENAKGENCKGGNPAEGSENSPRQANSSYSFLQLNDGVDEFYDFPDESEHDWKEIPWSSDENMHCQDQNHGALSTAAAFVKRLHELAVQKRGYIDLQEVAAEDIRTCCFGTTLPKDPSCNMACSWWIADPSTFLIRSKSYFRDNKKIEANSTLMQLVGADWLKSDKREDDLGGRDAGIVQKYAAQGGSEFFLVVNLQVPGSTTHNLALYYMMDTPLEKVPLLERFVKGDDAFRNSRFKFIPCVAEGAWIVKQSVRKKPGLIGLALETRYFHGSNYLEVAVDVGSSTVARGVSSLVLGYLNNLVIELAFLIQGNTEEELPELLLGTCRLNHMDASKSVPINGR